MTDRQVASLAIGVWVAALVPVGESLWPAALAALVAGLAFVRRSPWLLVAALAAVASFAAGASWESIGTVETGRYEGPATLVSDPIPVPGGIRVTAEIDGFRYDLRAWGSPAGHVRHRLMGERVDISATLRPLRDAPTWLRAKGITGRGTIATVTGFDVGAPHTRIANSVRRTIESGAASLGRDQRALFAGLVYGDDRNQSPVTADRFEAAGLTHLTAVSGQNIVFLLAIAGPLLRRLGHGQRFAMVVVVLVLFATVTRFEASVVRASVMTAIAATATLVGTEVSGRRVLGLAVAGLILVEPLIVHQVAFQLSVAASAGILLWSGRVARAIPGPRPLAEALAVTSTAQLAVSPLLIVYFDGLPVASLPANLLAGPAAGPIMMWGLTAGLIAGIGPGWAATVLHVPTQVGLWWIDSVAAVVPRLPLGWLGSVHIGALYGLGWWGLRQTSSLLRSLAAAGVLVALVHPAMILAATSPTHHRIDAGSMIWRDDSTTIVVLGSASRPETVLAQLRRGGVDRIDVLVAERSTYAMAALVGWIRADRPIDRVWAPEPTMGVGEVVPDAGAELIAGSARISVAPSDRALLISVGRAPPQTSAAPADP